MGFCIFTRGVYIYTHRYGGFLKWSYPQFSSIYRWIVPKMKRHAFWVPSMEPPIYFYIYSFIKIANFTLHELRNRKQHQKKHSSSQIFPGVPQFFGHWFGEREVAGEGPVGVAMKGLHLDRKRLRDEWMLDPWGLMAIE